MSDMQYDRLFERAENALADRGFRLARVIHQRSRRTTSEREVRHYVHDETGREAIVLGMNSPAYVNVFLDTGPDNQWSSVLEALDAAGVP